MAFVRLNKRWPDQRIVDERKLYKWMKKYSKMDWCFREELAPYKGKTKSTGRKPGKSGLHDSTIKLGLFLMDSGGTGSFE
jgi:hypothetical protein